MKKDPAVKISFSLPQSLAEAMERRMAELGIRKTSAFIQMILEREAERAGEPLTTLSKVPRIMEDAPTYNKRRSA